MKLERCEVKRFRKLKNFKAEFAAGLNVVKGPNEAGKSTLVEALGVGFFETPQSLNHEVQEKTTWGSDKKFEVSLELADGTGSWKLSKDFEKGEVKLEKVGSAEKWDAASEIEGVLSSRLGLAKKELFWATAFIRQGELALVSENPQIWRQKLEEAITGGREEVLAQRIAEKMAAKIAYFGEQGELGTAHQYKKEIEYQLNVVSEEVKNLLSNRSDLAEIEKTFMEVSRQAEDLRIRIERGRHPGNSKEELVLVEEKFHDLTARLREVEHSEKTIQRLREDAALEGDVLREDFSRLDEIEARLRYLESKRQEVGPLTAEPPKLPTPVPFLVGLGITIACLIAAFVAQKTFWVGVGLGAAWSAFSGLAFMRKFRESAQKEWQYKNSSGKRDELMSDLEKTQRELNELFARYRVTSTNELREKFETSRDRARQIKEETMRYENWLSDRTRGELEEELKATSRRLSELRENPLEVFDPVAPEELEVMGEKLAALEEERRHMETARNAIARHLEQTEDGVELKVALEERLEEENKKITEIEHKLKVCQKTLELWEEAHKKVLVEATNVLDTEVSKHLSEITDGRYSQARFDKQNLNFEVFSEEKKDFVNPHKVLSAGVRDQLYLSARLALLKFIFPDQKPLVILDEPFANFDPQRRQKAGELLVKLASEYQILLLTSQDYFDHLAAAKIQL